MEMAGVYNVLTWGPNNVTFIIFWHPYLVYGDLFVEFVDCLVILEHNRCQQPGINIYSVN